MLGAKETPQRGVSTEGAPVGQRCFHGNDRAGLSADVADAAHRLTYPSERPVGENLDDRPLDASGMLIDPGRGVRGVAIPRGCNCWRHAPEAVIRDLRPGGRGKWYESGLTEAPRRPLCRHTGTVSTKTRDAWVRVGMSSARPAVTDSSLMSRWSRKRTKPSRAICPGGLPLKGANATCYRDEAPALLPGQRARSGNHADVTAMARLPGIGKLVPPSSRVH